MVLAWDRDTSVSRSVASIVCFLGSSLSLSVFVPLCSKEIVGFSVFGLWDVLPLSTLLRPIGSGVGMDTGDGLGVFFVVRFLQFRFLVHLLGGPSGARLWDHLGHHPWRRLCYPVRVLFYNLLRKCATWARGAMFTDPERFPFRHPWCRRFFPGTHILWFPGTLVLGTSLPTLYFKASYIRFNGPRRYLSMYKWSTPLVGSYWCTSHPRLAGKGRPFWCPLPWFRYRCHLGFPTLLRKGREECTTYPARREIGP